jgi:hypothetical protein
MRNKTAFLPLTEKSISSLVIVNAHATQHLVEAIPPTTLGVPSPIILRPGPIVSPQLHYGTVLYPFNTKLCITIPYTHSDSSHSELSSHTGPSFPGKAYFLRNRLFFSHALCLTRRIKYGQLKAQRGDSRPANINMSVGC